MKSQKGDVPDCKGKCVTLPVPQQEQMVRAHCLSVRACTQGARIVDGLDGLLCGLLPIQQGCAFQAQRVQLIYQRLDFHLLDLHPQ